jgi:hypothetical protein
MSPMSSCGYRPCGAPIARHLLMCAAHWRLVPKDVQNRVYKHYRAKDWANWGAALDDARVAVATALGDPIPTRLMKPRAKI